MDWKDEVLIKGNVYSFPLTKYNKNSFKSYEEACKIYDKGFSVYICPSKYVELDKKGWKFISYNQMERTIDLICDMIKVGSKVKSGYMCTSIRGVHNFYIIYKD